MYLGEIVKKFREEHGMSMDEFAKLSGLSKGYVSMLEANKNPSSKKPLVPSLETVKAVAKATGVPINKIVNALDDDQTISTIKWNEENTADVQNDIDDDTTAILQELKDRPEMKILFSASSKATKEDIIRAAKFLDAMADESTKE